MGSWLVSYRSVSGEVVSTHHDTREGARDALTDQLIHSALQLWAIADSMSAQLPRSAGNVGESYGPTPFGPLAKRQREFFDRGDRFIHHVLRLVESTEGEYVIVGKQGRRWLLCEVPADVRV